MKHYIKPTLIDDQPDAIIIHVGGNDVIDNKSNDVEIANDILQLAENCKVAGVNHVFVSSILIKRNPKLTAVVRRVNDILRDMCPKNQVCFIDNDNITSKYLWTDGIHLQDLGTSILSKNFYDSINSVLFCEEENRHN